LYFYLKGALKKLSSFDSSERNTTPPGQIIYGEDEERAMADTLALQMVGTGMLVGRQITYAKTQGTEAVFEIEFEDGSAMVVKMLDYRARPSDEKTLKAQGQELMSGEDSHG